MTPAMCRTAHEPPTSYGDCLRACIATVMDLDTEQVPHFADMAATGQEALASARRWLASRGFTVACFALPGSEPLADVLVYMEEMNPTVTWLLFGSTAPLGTPPTNLHVSVCQGGRVVHDPSWVPTSIKQPYTEGGESIWQIWVVSRV